MPCGTVSWVSSLFGAHALGQEKRIGRKNETQSLGEPVRLRLYFTFFRFFRVHARLGECSFLAVGDEVLADLDGVEGGAFLDLVTAEPEGEA